MTEAPSDDLEVRHRLRELGYGARCCNFDAFDVFDRDGRWHYLSGDEARALATADITHPADLLAYGVKRGLNYWYTFPQSQR